MSRALAYTSREMPAATALDLPVLDYVDPTLVGPRFHEVLRDARARSWLARTDIGYLVLDRDAAIQVLRDRRLAFPAMQMLLLQGISDGPIYESNETGLMAKRGEPHKRLRRLVAPGMSPASVDRLRGTLHRFIDERWRSLAAAGRCEFVETFAKPIPSTVIAELLGLPGQAEVLAHWSIMLQAVFKIGSGADRADVEQAFREVNDAILALLPERRANPGRDFLSAVATYEENGDRLSDQECVTLAMAVISGGTDTTQAQLAHGMRLFADHPEQWELLASRPELAEQAANEVLRFEPITPFTARIAMEEVEYRDVTFPQGTLLFACAATANRDPSAFERPDEFDITVDRGHATVLTFGFGDHFCLGAQLSRMELAETFAYLAPRMRDLRLDGEPEFGTIIGIYPMRSLPLAFTPA
jgi:cytochrome P450